MLHLGIVIIWLHVYVTGQLPLNSLDGIANDLVGVVGIIEVDMVSSLGYDVYRGIIVARFGKCSNGRFASIEVHPIIVAIYRSGLHLSLPDPCAQELPKNKIGQKLTYKGHRHL